MTTQHLLRLTQQAIYHAARIMLAVVCLTAACDITARPISRQEASLRAQQFMQQQGDSRPLQAVTTPRRLAPRNFASLTTAEPYYVFDRGQDEGFVIVSGDDQTIDVLGYTDSGTFDYEQMPLNMRAWLDGYARQIAFIQAGGPVVNEVIPTHAKVDQLIKSKWSQGNPYNLTCPEYFTLGRSVTGCVATAMAQILYYNREKSVTETQAAMPAYNTYTNHPTYGTLHVEGIPAGSAIDWDYMKDEYGTATDRQKKAVADLMHYCGVAVKMDYTNSASGAQSYDAYQAFGLYFGYGSSVRYIDYTQVSSDAEWDRIVYAEMAAGRPVYVSGSNDEAGHAFVADGYDGNMRYHINWGWGGQSDGYYYLTNLTPGDGQGIGGSSNGYNSYREIIVGIEPENYSTKAMTISDATAKKVCLANWDADGDGKLTYGEAAAVTSLGQAFKGQTALKNFPELYYFTGLTALSDSAFCGCSQLATIRLPKTLSSVGACAFMDCAKLRQLVLPTGVRTIGVEAFSGCSLLTGISLPEEVTAIEDGTFNGCAAITAIELPVALGRLGSKAFAKCTHLASLTIRTFHPENIAMGDIVFAECSLADATLSVMQGTKAYFLADDQWQAFGKIVETRERSGGNFAQLATGQKYYLYNVGTGRYLTKGEAWGTQAIVGSEPMRFVISHGASMPEGIYYLTSEDTGKAGRYLFRTNTDENVGAGVKAAFVDGTSLTTNAHWAIRAVADKVYTIQTPQTDDNYAEGRYWGVQTDHESNAASPTYGVYSDIDYSIHPLNCQWQLVVYDADFIARYEAAETLASLLAMAKKKNLKTPIEQAVYDQLDSQLEELLTAQRSLRKKLGLIDFADADVRTLCVNLYDLNKDGEVSQNEAAQIGDLGYSFIFTNNTSLTSLDELQYFSNISYLYGNTFRGCTNLESVVLPEHLETIYYNAFYGCKKLKRINIPEYVTNIGQSCFQSCTSLREVTVSNPDPSSIQLGNAVFGGVTLSACTLYVPYGSKELYAAAPTWKNFGNIVEVRTSTQPRRSPIVADKPGYIMSIGTRKFLTMGEAYGTQSVVGHKGMVYQFKRSKEMADSVFYLYSDQTGKNGKVLFRASTDPKVGEGVKACFVDGNMRPEAYWRVSLVGENVYTLQVPSTDSNYQEGEYLGTDSNHKSDAASPTNGIYWDIKGADKASQWVFIAEEDMIAAKETDNLAAQLNGLIAKAKAQEIDVAEEQAVYDNIESTDEQLQAAIMTVRAKLHFITFADNRVQTLCVNNWDADNDGELSTEEAQAVTDIGETFRGANIQSFEELRYFTSLTAIPGNAFRNASSLQMLYLPANVRSIGQYAFTGSTQLRSMVVLNEEAVVPYGLCGLPSQATLFVPTSMMAAYESDADWSSRTLTEYTGKPIVTAVASRIYGRTFGTITTKVLGAPVMGTPETVCESMAIGTLPVGQYPITVMQGTITTHGVELREGVLTIEPSPLTITAKSYTRNVGEPNPKFELTYKSFRNKETDTVFTVRPVIVCEATPESPAGIYEISVSGAEAQNYAITYVSGTLTVVGTSAIDQAKADRTKDGHTYDMQGRRIGNSPQRGISIENGRKKVRTRR